MSDKEYVDNFNSAVNLNTTVVLLDKNGREWSVTLEEIIKVFNNQDRKIRKLKLLLNSVYGVLSEPDIMKDLMKIRSNIIESFTID